MYRLELDGRARRELNRLQGNLLQRILQAIADLRGNPRPPGCVQVKGQVGAYRVRVGDYRILYDVDDAGQTINIWRVRHRRVVYRDL